MITVKLGRFALRSKARKRIERATLADYFTGMWLVVDGRIPKRIDTLTPEQLERAEVRLGYGPLTTKRPSSTKFRCTVPYRATSAEIEAGWSVVADLVCADRRKP